jgi:pyruvate/2-oxoglutarate dehydrogenase complex dihydrolipoamide acyltransferase (E2) component
LSFDHRLIDGALADQFTGSKVKSVLRIGPTRCCNL